LSAVPPKNPGLIQSLLPGPLDIVGDIHGEIDALRDLLEVLGYRADGIHPQGRRLVFIGDLTDRGPDSPAVLERVMAWVSQGRAQCVLGNHELNLLREVEKEGNGWYFDVNHDERNHLFPHSKSLESSRRPAIRRFLSGLPLALERDDLRLVHAAWHAPSIHAIRTATQPILDIYQQHRAFTDQLAEDMGLKTLAKAEYTAVGAALRDPTASIAIQPSMAAFDALTQDSNPISLITSGLERMGISPFFASGKWRMVNRVEWWKGYTDDLPVIMGHYWRWPTPAARDTYSRGEPDLFADYAPNQWFGAKNNVFCVDFSVGARYKEREGGTAPPFECRLGAVRWPEKEVVMDDGARMVMTGADSDRGAAQ
jgi:hypothetical protein